MSQVSMNLRNYNSYDELYHMIKTIVYVFIAQLKFTIRIHVFIRLERIDITQLSYLCTCL